MADSLHTHVCVYYMYIHTKQLEGGLVGELVSS